MEKIYMENNNKKKKSKLNGSVIISFSVALVAIISLVAFGFNQISYAADEGGVFVFSDSYETSKVTNENKIDCTGCTVSVFQYSLSNNQSVYCLEADRNFPASETSGQTINKIIEINDAGLLYLMTNMYPNKKFNYNGTEANSKIQTWLTQTAIWIYLAENGYENNTKITSSVINQYKSATALYDNNWTQDNNQYLVGFNKPLYDSYVNSDGLSVNQILAKANELSYGSTTTLALSAENSTISLTSDEKYYQTSKISVLQSVKDSTLGTFESYTISLDKVPEGTIIVDTNGNQITEFEGIKITDLSEFYIRVPVDKLTDDNKKIEISIGGLFSISSAYKYSSGEDGQKITFVKKTNNIKYASLPIEFNYSPNVPDTGISKAQSIYFIGLIVLLSGIGIIYATVKPAKSN